MVVLKEQQHKHVKVKKASQEIETRKDGLEGKGRGFFLLCFVVLLVFFGFCLFFCFVFPDIEIMCG